MLGYNHCLPVHVDLHFHHSFQAVTTFTSCQMPYLQHLLVESRYDSYHYPVRFFSGSPEFMLNHTNSKLKDDRKERFLSKVQLRISSDEFNAKVFLPVLNNRFIMDYCMCVS